MEEKCSALESEVEALKEKVNKYKYPVIRMY